MLFDSHAHLNFAAFENEWKAVLETCLTQGVWVTNVGAQFKSSQAAVAIAEQYASGVYATIGLHPIHASGSSSNPEAFDVVAYRQLVNSSKRVVAIGETGIDFWHDADNLVSQQELFQQHLSLAAELNLPVVVHGRNSRAGDKDAYAEILKLVTVSKVRRCVAHCFAGTIDQARAFIELGFCIGVTGIVTYRNAETIQEIARTLPLERLVIETDSPYLPPEPHRGKKNYPYHVRFVAEQIAKLRGVSYETVAEQTFLNAKVLYNLE